MTSGSGLKLSIDPCLPRSVAADTSTDVTDVDVDIDRGEVVSSREGNSTVRVSRGGESTSTTGGRLSFRVGRTMIRDDDSGSRLSSETGSVCEPTDATDGRDWCPRVKSLMARGVLSSSDDESTS